MYCPPGYIDAEDGVGNIIEGAWRTDEEPGVGLQSLSRVGSNRFVTVLSHFNALLSSYMQVFYNSY